MYDPGFIHISVRDYDSEIGTMRLSVPELTAANFTAQETLRNAFLSALDAMLWGVRAKVAFGNAVTVSASLPTNNAAERESKAVVHFHDATTLRKYKIEIPAPDQSLKDPGDHKHYYIGDGGTVDAFVDAFEAYVRSPAGNPVVVDEITHAGRNI